MTSEGLAERKVREEARQKELAVCDPRPSEERAEADREAAKRRALLARVRDERAYHERMVGELTEATKRLEAFIRDLQAKQRPGGGRVPPRQRARAAAPGDRSGARASASSAGPAAAGRRRAQVVAEYGAQVHPRFGTKTFRNGIDIEVAGGHEHRGRVRRVT